MRVLRGQSDRLETSTGPSGAARAHLAAPDAAPPEGGWAGLHNCGLHSSDSSLRSSSSHRPFPLRDLWDPKESTPTSLRPAPPPSGAARAHLAAPDAAPPEGGWVGLRNCGRHGSDSSHRISSPHRPFSLRDLKVREGTTQPDRDRHRPERRG